jgi:uncharacterized protein YbjT (DUF2867 family)
MSIYCVLGAKGQTGRLIVKELIKRDNVKEVRCVVRSLENVPENTFPTSEKVKIMAGDVGKKNDEKLRLAITGAKGVFFVCAAKGYENVKAVDFKGVGITANIAKECNVHRFVLLTSQLVHPGNRYNFIRGILNTINTGLFHWSGMMDFKFAGEKLLRLSGVDYSIVRPGRLLDEEGGSSNFHVAQTNSTFMSTGISRADLALLLIAACDSSQTKNCTFEVACTKIVKGPFELKDELFNGLDANYDNKWGNDGRDVTNWDAEGDDK